MDVHSRSKELNPLFITSGQGRKARTLPFKRKLRLVGGSFSVTIPKEYVENFGFQEGQQVQLYLEVKP